MTLMTPDWVTEAADRERWRADEWGQWERLRERFHEAGVETLTPADQKLSGVVARGKELVDLSEPVQYHEPRPLLAALHRLSHRVTEELHEGIRRVEGRPSGA